jgi:tRNA threonylcarbamoyladenosine biosynthesis protein TsaE
MRAADVDVQTASARETEAVAAELAATLRPGDVVLVSGELGAGKTTFVRGACRALGIAVPVTSPTFTIARRYEDGRVPVSHLDLFRLAEGLGGVEPGVGGGLGGVEPGAGGGLGEEEPELLDEELGPDRVAFVEWPEAAGDGLPGVHVAARVRLEHRGGDRRRVVIER